MAGKKAEKTESKVAAVKKVESKPNKISVEALFEAGAHFGHRTDRWNPKIAPYLFGAQNGVHLFDLEKTYQKLQTAIDELRVRASRGDVVLFVGTKPQAKEYVRQAAQQSAMPYMTERWIGGLLTNFSQVKRSIDKLIETKRAREAGEYHQFTKKEQLLIDRDIARLERFLGGVVQLTKLPDVLFIVDINHEKTAVTEAAKIGIPTVAIVDSNSDPTLVDFPIPANDDATKAVELVMQAVGEAIKQGQAERPKVAPSEQPVAAVA